MEKPETLRDVDGILDLVELADEEEISSQYEKISSDKLIEIEVESSSPSPRIKKLRAKRKAERQNVKHNRNKQKRKKNKRG